MSTSTFAISYTNTVTYVTTKMMLLLKEIIREIGLDPSAMNWPVCEAGISTWLASRHLQQVTLEVYDPRTNGLVTKWDLDVVYDTIGEGTLWVDTAALRYAIIKEGVMPATCSYDIIVSRKSGYQPVPGWGSATLRSTDGFRRYSIGATVGGNGLHAQTAYWRR
jgi:hypothetical protein